MIILTLDLSFAKTGFAITKVNKKSIRLIDCGLLESNKKLDPPDRIEQHLNDIDKIYQKYKPDLTIKESAIMGRSSTGLNVIKTHGAFEYVYNLNTRPLDELHNATIKAWCRKYVNDKTLDKKKIVAVAVEKYYNKDMSDILYTPRGRLLDDIADAIAIGIVYYDKELKGNV